MEFKSKSWTNTTAITAATNNIAAITITIPSLSVYGRGRKTFPPIHTFPPPFPTMHCNKYCSFAYAPKVDDVKSPPSGPVPVSLSKYKNCKSHSSPFRRPFLVHRTQAKISHHSSGRAQKLTNPSRSQTLLPYPLLSPPPPRIQKSYFLPPHSVLPYTHPTLPQTSNFLTEMNHYSQPGPLSQHLTKPHPQPIRFIPRAYPVNVTQV